jgi:hypothetical protein
MGFASGELPDSCVFVLRCCLSVLGRFGGVLLGFVKVFLFHQFEVWSWFLLQGLEESLRLPRIFLCNFYSHRSDRRCSQVSPV